MRGTVIAHLPVRSAVIQKTHLCRVDRLVVLVLEIVVHVVWLVQHWRLIDNSHWFKGRVVGLVDEVLVHGVELSLQIVYLPLFGVQFLSFLKNRPVLILDLFQFHLSFIVDQF